MHLGDSYKIKTEPFGPVVWDWLTGGLANGSIKCKPDPEVVGHGLEACQAAVDRMETGLLSTFVTGKAERHPGAVSARKVVVEII